MPDPPPLVRLQRVSVSFGGHDALRDVAVDVPAGALIAVTGPNGAGKSTLAEVVAGVRRPTSGRVSRATVAVAYVPQRSALPERLPLTVRDLVAVGTWGSSRRRPGRDAARAAVDDALTRTGVGHLARRSVHALSGGQRQRALLAQGLARGADLLIVDEPTAGLDAASVEAVIEALLAERARGAGVVCVTHDRAVAECADLVLALDRGVASAYAPGVSDSTASSAMTRGSASTRK